MQPEGVESIFPNEAKLAPMSNSNLEASLRAKREAQSLGEKGETFRNAWRWDLVHIHSHLLPNTENTLWAIIPKLLTTIKAQMSQTLTNSSLSSLSFSLSSNKLSQLHLHLLHLRHGHFISQILRSFHLHARLSVLLLPSSPDLCSSLNVIGLMWEFSFSRFSSL